MKRKKCSIKFIICNLAIVFLLSGCKTTKLPSVKYNQYEYGKSYTYKDDTLKIELKNPLESPLRIWIFSASEELQKKFNEISPIVLANKSDTLLILSNINEFDNEIRFSSRLGSTLKKVDKIQLDLPFPKGKEYTILQGNNTNFTHNTNMSRYALDFDLKTNDTICSATNGYVVGIVDKYRSSGLGSEWKSYGNFITTYDPNSGVFCQYVHLVQNGSLVKIGDKIKRGQPIALSGNTGQSTMEHLHFSCLIPVNNEDGLKSIPIKFVGGIKGVDLKKGEVLKK